jgi:hypothetical protein
VGLWTWRCWLECFNLGFSCQSSWDRIRSQISKRKSPDVRQIQGSGRATADLPVPHTLVPPRSLYSSAVPQPQPQPHRFHNLSTG